MLTHDGGSSAPAVLLPALGEPPSSLAPLASALAAVGFEAVVLARRPRARFGEHVADTAQAIVDRGLASAIVVGASYGGLIACALAAAPTWRGTGLVLLDSPHPLSHAVVRAYVGRRAARTLPNAEGVDLADALAAARRCCRPGALGSVPVEVLSRGAGTWPGSDPDLPVADRVWLAHQHLHGQLSTGARVRVLPGVGHDVARESPQDVVAAVRRVAASTAK